MPNFNRYTIPQGIRYALDGLLWTPADITTLTWFDAADLSTLTLDGASVTAWNDKSGNNHHATQSDSTKQPTYDSANNQLAFDGNDILAVGNNVTLTDPYSGIQNFATIALVNWGIDSENNNLTVSWSSAGAGNTSNGWSLRERLGLCLTLRPGNDSGGSVYPSFGVDFIAVGVRYANNDINSRINGTITYTSNDGSTVNYSGMQYRSAIGGNFRGDNWTSPDFYLRNGSKLKEVVVIDGATETEVIKVEGYLAWKWGYESLLPSDHPWKNRAPRKAE